MCYLIAKKVDSAGCIAWHTSHGKHLAEFKKELIDKIGYEKIQFVTISRPSAYVEYEPYQFVNSRDEFSAMVEKM